MDIRDYISRSMLIWHITGRGNVRSIASLKEVKDYMDFYNFEPRFADCLLDVISSYGIYIVEVSSFEECNCLLDENAAKYYFHEVSKSHRKFSYNKKNISFKKLMEGEYNSILLFYISYLWLAISVARKLIGNGMSFMDLVQEGNIILWELILDHSFREDIFRWGKNSYETLKN